MGKILRPMQRRRDVATVNDFAGGCVVTGRGVAGTGESGALPDRLYGRRPRSAWGNGCSSINWICIRLEIPPYASPYAAALTSGKHGWRIVVFLRDGGMTNVNWDSGYLKRPFQAASSDNFVLTPGTGKISASVSVGAMPKIAAAIMVPCCICHGAINFSERSGGTLCSLLAVAVGPGKCQGAADAGCRSQAPTGGCSALCGAAVPGNFEDNTLDLRVRPRFNLPWRMGRWGCRIACLLLASRL